MKVKIVNCSKDEWWHSDCIGQTVEVKEEWSHDAFLVDDGEFGAVLPKIDSEIIGGNNE